MNWQVLVFSIWIIQLAGCLHGHNRDTNYTASHDPNIVNGIVYEKAVLDMLGPHDALVLPVEAKVKTKAGLKSVEVILEKELAVSGNPSTLVSIDEIRHDLGIAYIRENQRLLVATFGEYLLDGAGGADIKLTVNVPAGTKFEFGDSLAGPQSKANPPFNTGRPNPSWNPVKTDSIAIPKSDDS